MSQTSLQGVRASAGSGKTYRLATEYLAALRGGAQPQQILATTFTRKAAGEILGRVLQRLALAAGEDDRARDDLARLCGSLHHVNICTLDSFFHRLAHCFRHELDLPPDARLLDDQGAEAAALRFEAIRATLEERRAGDETEEMLRLLEDLHGGAARRPVAESLDDLLRSLHDLYLDVKDEHAWGSLEVPEPLDERDLAAALGALREAAAAATNGHWRNALNGNAEAAASGDWLKFVGAGIAAKVVEEETQFQRLPITAETFDLYEPLLQHARAELLGPVRQQSRATHALLRRFDRHYAAARHRRRAFLFADLPRALLQAVPGLERGEVAYRLGVQVEHLLLDEFQDTNPAQWKILRPFAERIAADRDEGPRSFFCVGDVKQSIYGWRGACPELFGEVENALPGLGWESTAQSWRSSQVVLDCVNTHFSALEVDPALKQYRPVAARWREAFPEHREHPERRSLPGYVELVTTPAPFAAAEESDGEEEAEAASHLEVAARIVRDLERKHPGRSIGVLFRTNAGVRALLYHLQRLGVPASGEGGGPVDDDPAVETVLAALTLADHPGNSAAAFQVARSPLGKIVGFDTVADKPSEPEAVAVARSIRRRLMSEGLAAVLADWSRAVAPACDERGIRRLSQLVTLADTFPGPNLRPAEFVEYARTTRVEEPAPAPVRVMTIHGAKGLEFDIVVLPELGKRIDPAYDPPAVLLERDSPTSPIRAVYRCPPKPVRALSPQLRQAYEQHAGQALGESFCLLYVAMTRAVHALHMIVPPLKESGGKLAVGQLSHATLLRAALQDEDLQEAAAGGQTLYRAGDPDWSRNLAAPDAPGAAAPEPAAVRLAPPGPDRRRWPEVRPSELALGGIVPADRLLTLEDLTEREFGTVIHAWFAMIEWSDDPPPDDAALLQAGRRAVPGRPAAWYPDALKQWKGMLASSAVRSALARPALPPQAEVELWREQRFAARVGDHLTNGMFDRVVIVRENTQVVRVQLLDFKTETVDDTTIAGETAIYRPQIEEYAASLAAMLRIERPMVETMLLIVTSNRTVRL